MYEERLEEKQFLEHLKKLFLSLGQLLVTFRIKFQSGRGGESMNIVYKHIPNKDFSSAWENTDISLQWKALTGFHRFGFKGKRIQL